MSWIFQAITTNFVRCPIFPQTFWEIFTNLDLFKISVVFALSLSLYIYIYSVYSFTHLLKATLRPHLHWMLCAVHVIGLSCRIRNSEHLHISFRCLMIVLFNVVHSHFSPSITFRNHSGKDILRSDGRMTKIRCKTLNWEALCVEPQQVHSPQRVCVLYLTNTGN
jgi:predicted membrane protein